MVDGVVYCHSFANKETEAERNKVAYEDGRGISLQAVGRQREVCANKYVLSSLLAHVPPDPHKWC